MPQDNTFIVTAVRTVLWDMTQCSVVDNNVSEVLSASIFREMIVGSSEIFVRTKMRHIAKDRQVIFIVMTTPNLMYNIILFLCLIEHCDMKTYGGRGKAPHIQGRDNVK
jgi:hypothetical protein